MQEPHKSSPARSFTCHITGAGGVFVLFFLLPPPLASLLEIPVRGMGRTALPCSDKRLTGKAS